MKNYTELDVWKLGRELVKETYLLTEEFPKHEQFGLTSQMRRSSVSIPSNIAEGIGRNYPKDTIQFLYISRGSAYELETQYYVSFDLKLISETDLNIILEKITIIKKLLNGLINHYFKKIT